MRPRGGEVRGVGGNSRIRCKGKISYEYNSLVQDSRKVPNSEHMNRLTRYIPVCRMAKQPGDVLNLRQ